MSENNWKNNAIQLALNTDLSWREIAQALDVPKSTVSDLLRKAIDVSGVDMVMQKALSQAQTELSSYKASEYNNERVLVISDLHAPYHHPKTLDFLDSLTKKYNFTRIISVGDEQDISAASFHDYDADLMSAGHELKAAQKFMKELESRFPVMDIMSSNHGDLYYRKAKHHGIPLHVIKSYNDVLGVGDGWKWHNDLVITLPTGEDVYFCHGKSANGLKLSQNMSMNAVQGHYHNSFNIQYWSSPRQLYWSMQVGCLIDDKSLAMAYNKLTVNRPIIGCGVIIDGVPKLEVMKL